MADVIKWPDVTLPSYGTTEDVEDTSIRSTFEDGTIQANYQAVQKIRHIHGLALRRRRGRIIRFLLRMVRYVLVVRLSANTLRLIQINSI